MTTKQASMTIYNPDLADELKDYTLKFLMMLKDKGYIENDIENIIQALGEDDGFGGEAESGGERELEYVQIDGKEFYYDGAHGQVYTYSSKPQLVGFYDVGSKCISRVRI